MSWEEEAWTFLLRAQGDPRHHHLPGSGAYPYGTAASRLGTEQPRGLAGSEDTALG